MNMNDSYYSLRKKGLRDQRRLAEKVEEAIKKNLQKYLVDEAIIMRRGNETIKIPLRGLKLPEFEHDYSNGASQVGSGKDVQNGQVIGKDSTGKAQQPGQGGKGDAGEDPGEPIFEAEILVDDLVSIAFEELGLPDLEELDENSILSPTVDFTDIREKGIASNIDLKRTLLNNLKRNASLGKPGIRKITRDDLRYKVWEDNEEKVTQACIIAMMDTSGSMGTHEQFLVRTMLTWVVRFLRRSYTQLEIQFITHDAIARRVDEEHFFKAGSSGGTKFSSAYELAKALIFAEFPPTSWNLYVFHFTDGENLSSDNEVCLNLMNDILKVVKRIYYGEINVWEGRSFYEYLDTIKDKKLVKTKIRDKNGVLQAIQDLLGRKNGNQS